MSDFLQDLLSRSGDGVRTEGETVMTEVCLRSCSVDVRTSTGELLSAEDPTVPRRIFTSETGSFEGRVEKFTSLRIYNPDVECSES